MSLEIKAAEPITLKLSELTLDPELLLRPLDEATAQSYADAIKAGAKLPPILVMQFPDGSRVCVDGQHRYRAHQILKRDRVACEVQEGDRLTALLASASSNCEHGKPRTPEDKRRAVLALRAQPEWQAKSARWIAEACRVSPTFASKVLSTVHADSSEAAPATEGKDGKTRKAPQRPKRKAFDAAREVKAAARVVDALAKRWPSGASVAPLVEALTRRLTELQKRACEAPTSIPLAATKPTQEISK